MDDMKQQSRFQLAVDINLNYLVYYLALSIYIFIQLGTRVSLLSVNVFFYHHFSTAFILIVFFLVVKEILSGAWNASDILSLLISIGITICMYCVNPNIYMPLPLLIFCARNLNLKSIFKVGLFFQLIGLLIIVVLFFRGVLPNPDFSSSIGALAFGFKYHTYLPNMILFDTLIYFGVFPQNISKLKIAIFLLIDFIVFRLSDYTMNAFILMTAFLAICLLYPYLKSSNFFSRLLFVFSFFPPIIWGLMLLIYSTGSDLGVKLNELFSNRLMLSWQGVQQFGFHWGPNSSVQLYSIDYRQIIGARYNYIDSGLTKYTLIFGIPIMILLYFLFFKTELFFVHQDNPFMVLVILILMMHFVVDEEVLWLDMNLGILLLTVTMRAKQRKKGEWWLL